jgi:ankyrin repeat protein
MKAVQGGKKAAVDALIAKGADVNLQDSLGNSSVHHLAKKLNVKIESVLSSLTAAGAKLEVKNANGETALIVAAKANNLTGAKLLIKAGAERNALDMNGDSVATIFLKAGNRSAANELVKLGVSSQVASK